MLQWLIPISLVWIIAAVYLGGTSVDLSGGGGVRQLVGLVLTVALFLAVWGGLHAILGESVVVGLVIPTVIAILVFPALAWLGFKLVGVHLRRLPAGGGGGGAGGAH